MIRFLRQLRADERGNSPWLLMASLALYTIVSVGLVAGLIGALVASSSLRVNASLKENAVARVQIDAQRGYAYVAALPATSNVTLSASGLPDAIAVRTVTIAPSGLAAKVTVSVGAHTGAGRADSSTCATTPANCIITSEVVTRPRTAP